MTKGQCFVALGQSWASRVETEAFGIDALDGPSVTGERIEAMFRAWERTDADGSLDISTSVDRAILHARVSPAPYRRPRPLIGRASTTPATIRAAGSRGLPVVFGVWTAEQADTHLELYRTALEESGHDREQVEECLSWAVYTVPVIVGRTDREAQSRLESYRAAGRPNGSSIGSENFWEEEWTTRELGKTKIAVVGSPQRIVDAVGSAVAGGARGVRLLPVLSAGRPDDHDDFFGTLFSDVIRQLDPEPLPAPRRRRPAVDRGPAH